MVIAPASKRTATIGYFSTTKLTPSIGWVFGFCQTRGVSKGGVSQPIKAGPDRSLTTPQDTTYIEGYDTPLQIFEIFEKKRNKSLGDSRTDCHDYIF